MCHQIDMILTKWFYLLPNDSIEGPVLDVGEVEPNEMEKLDKGKWPNGPHS